jgi:hypothetical protein
MSYLKINITKLRYVIIWLTDFPKSVFQWYGGLNEAGILITSRTVLTRGNHGTTFYPPSLMMEKLSLNY